MYQEYNLKLTPATPIYINYPPPLIKPQLPHPPRVPCYTSSSRCIRHTTRYKPGVVTGLFKTYFIDTQKIEDVWKGWKTNNDLDHHHNPTTYMPNISYSPPSLQAASHWQELTRMWDCLCDSIISSVYFRYFIHRRKRTWFFRYFLPSQIPFHLCSHLVHHLLYCCPSISPSSRPQLLSPV